MVKKPNFKLIERYLQSWDPLGVTEDLITSGNPPTEYDDYAPEVYNVLASNSGTQKLVQLFENIQLNRMELSKTNKERDLEFAEGIIKCYKERKELFYK